MALICSSEIRLAIVIRTDLIEGKFSKSLISLLFQESHCTLFYECDELHLDRCVLLVLTALGSALPLFLHNFYKPIGLYSLVSVVFIRTAPLLS